MVHLHRTLHIQNIIEKCIQQRNVKTAEVMIFGSDRKKFKKKTYIFDVLLIDFNFKK